MFMPRPDVLRVLRKVFLPPPSVYDRPPYWGRPDVLHVFLTEGLPSPSLFDLAEYSMPVCGAEAEGELRLLQSVT